MRELKPIATKWERRVIDDLIGKAEGALLHVRLRIEVLRAERQVVVAKLQELIDAKNPPNWCI